MLPPSVQYCLSPEKSPVCLQETNWGPSGPVIAATTFPRAAVAASPALDVGNSALSGNSSSPGRGHGASQLLDFPQELRYHVKNRARRTGLLRQVTGGFQCLTQGRRYQELDAILHNEDAEGCAEGCRRFKTRVFWPKAS